MQIKITNNSFLLAFLAISASVFAQHTPPGGPKIAPPGQCPSGFICKTGTGTTDTSPAGGPGPKSGDAAAHVQQPDPAQQRILAVAQQLELTSDQRSELNSALKAEKGERAEIGKALRDARRSFADALANGQTFLDVEIESLAAANAKAQESELKEWAKLYAILTPDQERRLLSMSTPLSLATNSPGTMQGQ